MNAQQLLSLFDLPLTQGTPGPSGDPGNPGNEGERVSLTTEHSDIKHVSILKYRLLLYNNYLVEVFFALNE